MSQEVFMVDDYMGPRCGIVIMDKAPILSIEASSVALSNHP